MRTRKIRFTILVFILLSAASARANDAFINDLQQRSFLYFWEQADPNTGLVPDRARMDGSP
ncbi:MAG TPA: hypothetical protein VJP89_09800, partial [Pyrinomonadaceae bacterium]|nr:hypothetical protein [Pyrinomonadaceae bacterium]